MGNARTVLRCRSCQTEYEYDLTTFPCPECGGILEAQYDYGAVHVDRSDVAARSGSMWRFKELLPVQDREAIVSMGEGTTPLIECETLADEIGVGRLFIKDEGQNPTTSFKDRGVSVAVSMANEASVEEVSTTSSGNMAQSTSAYAAKAGMDSHVYMKVQENAMQMALTRGHGATVYPPYGDVTIEEFQNEQERHEWYKMDSFQNPYRQEGKKTIGFEIFEALGWRTPDHIAMVQSSCVGLIGIWKGYRELAKLGWLADDGGPSLTVTQPEGMAPVAEAIIQGQSEPVPFQTKESVIRSINNGNPVSGEWIIDDVNKSDGYGVAVPDKDAFDAALRVAQSAGVEMCVTSAVALAGVIRLADHGVYDDDDEVVVVNTANGGKEWDQLDSAVRQRTAPRQTE